MPITSSAKKALKRSRFLEKINLPFKVAMKKAIKAVKQAVETGVKGKKMEELVVQAYSAIDKAAKKNIIHRNRAAKKKSRVANIAAAK